MKQFKDYIVEYEIHHDGHGNYRDDEGNEWTSRSGSAHRSSFGRRHTITSNQPDHPHSVHINGKKWKTFGSHSHATNVARKIQGATVHREEVQLDEISDKTLMSYAQKVHDDSMKHDQDPTKRSAEKRNKSVMGFSRALNKLESRPHKEETVCPVCKKDPCECDDSHGFVKEESINELSSELLARYKEKAGLAASAADKAKKYDLGHKRFKGIMKATFKQFANDAKK